MPSYVGDFLWRASGLDLQDIFQKTCLSLYEKRTGFCCLSKVYLFDFLMRRFWNRDLLGEYSKFSPGKYSTLLNFYLIDHLKNGILYTSLTFSMHACVKLVLQVFHMECLNAELLMSTLFSFHKMCKKILTFLFPPHSSGKGGFKCGRVFS